MCPRRTYCETDIDPAHRKLSQLQAVVQYLTGKEPHLECKWTLSSQHINYLYVCVIFITVGHIQCLIFMSSCLTSVLCVINMISFALFLSTGDAQLLQQTLFDAVVTAPMEAYWTALMLNTSG